MLTNEEANRIACRATEIYQASGTAQAESAAYGYTSIGGGGGGGSAYWAGGTGGAGGAGVVLEFPSLSKSTDSWRYDFQRSMEEFRRDTDEMAREQSEFATRFLLFVGLGVEVVFLLAWAGL